MLPSLCFIDTVLSLPVLATGHMDWAVALVPAACQLQLKEHERGLRGLVLHENDLRVVTNETCVRFLRNLVTCEGHPHLADQVRTAGEMYGADAWIEGIPFPRDGFGNEGMTNGVSLADCAPALRAALAGHDVPVPKKPAARKRR